MYQATGAHIFFRCLSANVGNEHHGPDHILAALTQHLQKLRNKCGNNPVVHNMSSQEVQRLSDGYHVVVCL